MTDETALVVQQEEELASLLIAGRITQGNAPKVMGTDPFLKMGKDGIWIYGQENIEVQPGSLWAINPKSYQTGYICWTRYEKKTGKKNVKLGKVVCPIGGKVIDPSTLPVHYQNPDEDEEKENRLVWEWGVVYEAEFTCLNGEDKGKKLLYEGSSDGAKRVLKSWFDTMLDMVGEGTPVLIVELASESYSHPQWGKTYKPVFNYSGWRGLFDKTLPGEEETPKIAAPVETKRRASVDGKKKSEETKTENADEGKPPAPTRRRPAA